MTDNPVCGCDCRACRSCEARLSRRERDRINQVLAQSAITRSTLRELEHALDGAGYSDVRRTLYAPVERKDAQSHDDSWRIVSHYGPYSVSVGGCYGVVEYAYLS